MNPSKSKQDRVLFLGCGDLGTRAGERLLLADCVVAGARRDVSKLPDDFVPLSLDYTQVEQLRAITDFDAGHLVISFKPLSMDAAGYRAGFVEAAERLVEVLADLPPGRIYFVSSTRVFAERDGGWVDEQSPRSRDDERALAMLEAERLLRELSPCTAVYFSGLYGGAAGRLLARIRRGQLSAAEPARYSNRIHRTDAAAVLAHLITLDREGTALAPGYISSDDEPALQAEVERWLARKLGVEEWRDAPAAASGLANKRCSNALLRATGLTLQYPDYRSGYEAVIAAED